jgi:hypothetical protein
VNTFSICVHVFMCLIFLVLILLNAYLLCTTSLTIFFLLLNLSFALLHDTNDDQLFKLFLMFSYIYVDVKFN